MGTFLNPRIFSFRNKVSPSRMPSRIPSYHSGFRHNSDMDLYTVATGDWKIDPENYMACYNTAGGRDSNHMTEAEFADVVIEAMVRPEIDGERDIGIYARTDGTDQNNYILAIGCWNYRTGIGKTVNGSATDLVGVGDYTDLTTGKWYHLKATLRGSDLKVENLTTEDTVTATDTDLAEGYVGFYLYDGGTSGIYGGDFRFLTVRRL